jgi:hypothetical protein
MKREVGILVFHSPFQAKNAKPAREQKTIPVSTLDPEAPG